jgi:hypothetical protein
MARQLYEWDPGPPTAGQRVFAGIWIAAFLLVLGSYVAGWRLLGDYDKLGVAALMFIGLILFVRVLPSAKRI